MPWLVFEPGLRVNVYLNMPHTLNLLATMAGFRIEILWTWFDKLLIISKWFEMKNNEDKNAAKDFKVVEEELQKEKEEG